MKVSDLEFLPHTSYWRRAEVRVNDEVVLGIYRNEGYTHHPTTKVGDYLVVWSANGWDNGNQRAARKENVDLFTLALILADPMAFHPKNKSWFA